jgi:hypothetical protein
MSGLGLTLFVEGEKAFKDALSDVNLAMKQVQSEMNLAVSGFDKYDNSMASVAATLLGCFATCPGGQAAWRPLIANRKR